MEIRIDVVGTVSDDIKGEDRRLATNYPNGGGIYAAVRGDVVVGLRRVDSETVDCDEGPMKYRVQDMPFNGLSIGSVYEDHVSDLKEYINDAVREVCGVFRESLDLAGISVANLKSVLEQNESERILREKTLLSALEYIVKNKEK